MTLESRNSRAREDAETETKNDCAGKASSNYQTRPGLRSKKLNQTGVKATEIIFQILQFDANLDNRNSVVPASSHYF